jgi:hypothetical protein
MVDLSGLFACIAELKKTGKTIFEVDDIITNNNLSSGKATVEISLTENGYQFQVYSGIPQFSTEDGVRDIMVDDNGNYAHFLWEDIIKDAVDLIVSSTRIQQKDENMNSYIVHVSNAKVYLSSLNECQEYVSWLEDDAKFTIEKI